MLTNVNLDGGTNATGFIRVINVGGFLAYFAVGYDIGGMHPVKISPTLSAGDYWKIGIPLNATNVGFEAYVAVYIQSWMSVYRTAFSTVPQKCFVMNGTVFNPRCFETPCPSGDNGIPPVGGTPNCCCNCCCNCNCSCNNTVC